MKHVNVPLPDELHERLKISCNLEGKNIADVVRQLVERYVQEVEKRKLIVIQKSKV